MFNLRARWPRGLVAMFLACSAGALGAAALSAGPAQAAPTAPDGSACGGPLQPLCAPATPTVNASSSETDGTITITWHAVGMGVSPTPGAALLKWTPSVSTLPGGAPIPPTVTPVDLGSCASTGKSVLVCTYPWPSALKSGQYVLNGTYTLTASATDCLPASVLCSKPPTMTSGSINVDNPAAAPAHVKAVVQDTSQAKITWDPNGEPDITGYQVFRDGTSAPICTVSVFVPPVDTSCVDSPNKDGAYTYHVVAYRWSPSYSTAVADQAASAPAPTQSVSLKGTSVNTTTTTVPGGGTGALGPPGFAATPTPGKAAGLGTTGTFRATPGTAAGAGATPAAGSDTPAGGDTGFLPNLPYGQTTTTTPSDQAALSAPPAPHKGKTSVGTIAVIGAGLLVAVIALHGLWLRSEVRRTGTLEALDPEV